MSTRIRITDFSRLTHAISKLGITISRAAREYRERLFEGIDVDETTEYFEGEKGIYTLDPDGKIHKVLLYITQNNFWHADKKDDWREWHKYHILNCTTLKKYPPERKYRYKMVSRVDGLFIYSLYKNNKLFREFKGDNRTKLKLCSNCERKYKQQTGEQFDLKKFIYSEDSFSRIGPTRPYDFEDIPNIYSDVWPRISEVCKKRKKWICESCNIDLSSKDHRKYLHAHHIDGNKTNNLSTNLRALCINCHSDQPLHEHIKKGGRFKEFNERILPEIKS